MDCKNENWTSFHYLFWRLKTPLFPAHYPTALSKIPCELYFGKWWWWQCCDGICESKEMDIYKKSKFWWRGELTCGVLSGKMRLVCNNGNNLIYEIVRVHCGLRSWGHLLWPFSGQRIWIGNWLCVECFLCLFIVGFSIYYADEISYTFGSQLLLLLLLLSRFSRVRLCATPWTAAYQASLSMGFSRQEHWSGLPFPSPVHESGKWKWSRSVVSDS